jgi:hypothetical protein
MIVSRTPVWVWGLLTGLVALGLSHAVDRRASLTRVLIMPVAMTVMALFGVVSAFGSAGQLAGVLVLWALSVAASVAILSRGSAPAGTHYDSALKQFHLAGSWVPLALILCIFMTKYVVGIETAMDTTLTSTPSFALGVTALYGVFSGVFVARALRLLRLARPAAGQHAAVAA